MRILLVEDEESIHELIKFNLEAENYEVISAKDGRKAIDFFKTQYFDLIILDVMLPEVDGYNVCELIRLTNTELPILMLTAKDMAQDRIMGLKKGADDYLTKPFNLEELILRVQNLLKRSNKELSSSLESFDFDNNSVNFVTFEAKGKKGNFILTKKEAALFKLLIDRKNEVVSRHQILQAVWGYDVYPSTRTIDNFILSFRKYFEEDPKNPIYFNSVRGIGYKFIYNK